MMRHRGQYRAVVGVGFMLLLASCGEIAVHPAPQVSGPTRSSGPQVSRVEAPAGAPDVVLITVDTLRADHVGAYGAEFGATPNIDRLAAESALFEQAFTTAPLTLPAHASILTGLLPPQHGVRHNGVFFLRPGAETLAEAFRKRGWKTGAVLGAVVLGSQFGLQQGFDDYDDRFEAQREEGADTSERIGRDVTDRALRWVEGAEEPFFLWAHYFDPHADYRAPEPWASRFPESPYVAEIAYVDEQVGRLLAALRGRDRWDQTIVVLTSDHGEGLGDHGESTHAYFLYDSVLQVPLLVRTPGQETGSRRDDPVSNAAIGPTLAALANLEPLDGKALPSLFSDEVAEALPLYAETLAPELDFGWAPLSAARDRQYAYIHGPKPELYDTRADRQQTRDLLAAEPSQAVGEARGRLEARVSAVLALASVSGTTTVDAQTAQQIEALGYVVPQQAPERTGMNPKDGQRWIELMSSASVAYVDNRFEDAEAQALEVLQAFPESVRMHRIVARIALATGRAEDALPHAQALVRLHGGNADHHALLGRALLRVRRLDEAVAAFETGVEEDPDAFKAHLGAMWKGALGRPVDEVRFHAERAISLAGETGEIFERVGETWEGLGAYDEALATYQRGLEGTPGSERLHMRMAIQYARRDEADAFQVHHERAGAAGARPELLNRLGIVYAAKGDHHDAERIFSDLLTRHPGDRMARLNLARVFEQTGRPSLASALREGKAFPHPPARPTR